MFKLNPMWFRCDVLALLQFHIEPTLLGMAIFARLAGFTWPRLTLMGRILPSPIRNRVGYGFKKKKTRSGSGFYQKNLKPDPKPGPNKTRFPWNYKNTPYIYSYYLTLNPSFLQQQFTPPSVPPHPHFLISAHSLSITASHLASPPPLKST